MHRYLRAAGFSDYRSEKAVRTLLKQAVKEENLTNELRLDDGAVLKEYSLPVNDNIGLKVAMLYVDGEEPELYYYYPYYDSYTIATNDGCVVERMNLVEHFQGVIDDYRPGISLIFFISNPLDFRKLGRMGYTKAYHGTALGAFANYGTVLLPVANPTPDLSDLGIKGIPSGGFSDGFRFGEAMKDGGYGEIFFNRNFGGDASGFQGYEEWGSFLKKLMNAFGLSGADFSKYKEMDGPVGFMGLGKDPENGSEDEFGGFKKPEEGDFGSGSDDFFMSPEYYDQIRERMKDEDVYSLVEQSIVPTGIECDQYLVIGEIRYVEEGRNSITGEELYLMDILSNGIFFSLCIRKEDLVGEPLRGRRLKARVWLMGKVNFDRPDREK